MKTNYYKMFPEKQFAIVVFQSEKLTIEEAEKINYEYKSDPRYSAIAYLLVMFKKCMPQFNPSELKFLSNSYNTALQTNNHKKVVWLVDEPLATAYAHLFVSFTEGNSYCSTIEQAYSIFDIAIEFDEFARLINRK